VVSALFKICNQNCSNDQISVQNPKHNKYCKWNITSDRKLHKAVTTKCRGDDTQSCFDTAAAVARHKFLSAVMAGKIEFNCHAKQTK
jgi:hypothetical protein